MIHETLYFFLHPCGLSVPVCLLLDMSCSLSFGSFSAWLNVYLAYPGGVFIVSGYGHRLSLPWEQQHPVSACCRQHQALFSLSA